MESARKGRGKVLAEITIKLHAKQKESDCNRLYLFEYAKVWMVNLVKLLPKLIISIYFISNINNSFLKYNYYIIQLFSLLIINSKNILMYFFKIMLYRWRLFGC